MSTLGLSGSSETSEGLWATLFWPTIQNAQDADIAATRGFWICFVLAFVSSTIGSGGVQISAGLNIETYLDLAVLVFYLLGAVGVRESSSIAAASMFGTYLLGTVLYFWLSPSHFSFLRVVGLGLLLTTLRAAVLIQRWKNDPFHNEDFQYGPTRLNTTWRDKIVDQLPMRVWPWGRFIFYALAAVLIPLECMNVALLFVHRS